MGKEITSYIKIQVKGGEAAQGSLTAIFGSKGLGGQIKSFCDEFNAKTKDRKGELIPVIVTIYSDKIYSFITKHEPVATSLLKAINVEKGSGTPNQNKIGTVTKEQVKAIAQKKMEDLNARTIEKAMNIIEGTARSIGVKIEV